MYNKFKNKNFSLLKNKLAQNKSSNIQNKSSNIQNKSSNIQNKNSNIQNKNSNISNILSNIFNVKKKEKKKFLMLKKKTLMLKKKTLMLNKKMLNKKSLLFNNKVNNLKKKNFLNYISLANKLQLKQVYLKKLKKKEGFFNYYKKVKELNLYKNKKKKFLYNKLSILSSKHFKNIVNDNNNNNNKKLKKKKIILKKKLKFDRILYKRVIFLYNIYKKYNKKYFFFNNKLKKLKKKKSKRLNFNIYLWNSLNLNYNLVSSIFKDYINYMNINLDEKFKSLLVLQNNYLLKKGFIKRRIFYTIFKRNNINRVFLKNRYKIWNKPLLYRVKYTEKVFNIFCNFKKINYFNEYFTFKFNDYIKFYLIKFYNILKFNLINKIKRKLQLYNSYSFLIDIELEPDFLDGFETFDDLEKAKIDINNFNINVTRDISLNLDFYKSNTLKNFESNNKLIYKNINSSIRYLIKKKKWSKGSFTDSFTKFLKQVILNNSKLNMYYNFTYNIKNKENPKIIHNKFSLFLKDKKSKVSKYNGYFFIFLKKYQMYKKNIFKRFKIYNRYVLKKYNFLLVFIKFYLAKIFIYWKFILYGNNINNYNYILKLKFLMCYMYYKMFLRFKNFFKKKKKTKKIILKNIVPTFNLLYIYKSLFKNWIKKKKQKWYLKKSKKTLKKFNNMKINFFKYNFKLNPYHYKWMLKKKKKIKKMKYIYARKVSKYIKKLFKLKRRKIMKYKLKLKKINKMKKLRAKAASKALVKLKRLIKAKLPYKILKTLFKKIVKMYKNKKYKKKKNFNRIKKLIKDISILKNINIKNIKKIKILDKKKKKKYEKIKKKLKKWNFIQNKKHKISKKKKWIKIKIKLYKVLNLKDLKSYPNLKLISKVDLNYLFMDIENRFFYYEKTNEEIDEVVDEMEEELNELEKADYYVGDFNYIYTYKKWFYALLKYNIKIRNKKAIRKLLHYGKQDIILRKEFEFIKKKN